MAGRRCAQDEAAKIELPNAEQQNRAFGNLLWKQPPQRLQLFLLLAELFNPEARTRLLYLMSQTCLGAYHMLDPSPMFSALPKEMVSRTGHEWLRLGGGLLAKLVTRQEFAQRPRTVPLLLAVWLKRLPSVFETIGGFHLLPGTEAKRLL